MSKKPNIDDLDDFDEDFSEFEDEAESPRKFDDLDTLDPAAMLERFEQMVDDRIKVLLSRSADLKTRIEAAAWLGNSGVPKAITALRKIYKGEKDKKLKNAAGYALGQFKALDLSIERGENESVLDALEREENATVRELLEQIALGGGPQPQGTPRVLRVALGLLGMLLVVLIGLNGAVVAGLFAGSADETDVVVALPTATIDPTTPEGRAVNELNAMQQRAIDVRGDAETIQQQVTAFESAGTLLNCAYAFKRPAAYTVPSVITGDYPAMSGIGEGLNAAITTLDGVFTTYDGACGRDVQQPLPAEITTLKTALTSLLENISSVETDITALQTEIIGSFVPTETPAPEVTPTLVLSETPTSEPTIEPTPTLDRVTINNYIRDLYTILDNVSQRDGARTLLLTFWTDVVNSGATDGCRLPRPAIPENYGEIPADVLAVVPTLVDARNQINTGLDLLRTGWQAFDAACAAGSLGAQAQQGQQTAQLADTTFTNANNILNAARR